jgi:hypothetical protein
MEAGADKSESQLAEGKWSYHVPKVYRVKHIASAQADISCARKAQLQHIKVKKAECVYFHYQNQLPTKCRQLIFSFVNPE